jgi:hypothetical protein
MKTKTWRIDDFHAGIIDEHGDQVFTLNDCENKYTAEERKENVVLISKAPELLKALLDLLHNEADSQADAIDLIEEITGKRPSLGY